MEENKEENVTNEVVQGETQNTQETNNEKKLNICCLLSFIFSMVGLIMFGLFLRTCCNNIRYYRSI